MRALPFSESSERNKTPILLALQEYINPGTRFLDFSCGTGQHTEYFCEQFPQITFDATEVEENLWMVNQRMEQTGFPNFNKSYIWSMGDNQKLPLLEKYDYVFTANTFHIMSFPQVKEFLDSLESILKPSALFCLYGPFTYDGEFIGEGNIRFDQMLRSRSGEMGLREFNKIKDLLACYNIQHVNRFNLPANNQLHIFKKA